jgi:RNase P/RNase MRP subunit p29
MAKSNLIDIEARIVHETEKAWLLDTGEKKPTWVPKSSAEFDGTTLTIPEPLALEKGLI